MPKLEITKPDSLCHSKQDKILTIVEKFCGGGGERGRCQWLMGWFSPVLWLAGAERWRAGPLPTVSSLGAMAASVLVRGALRGGKVVGAAAGRWSTARRGRAVRRGAGLCRAGPPWAPMAERAMGYGVGTGHAMPYHTRRHALWCRDWGSEWQRRVLTSLGCAAPSLSACVWDVGIRAGLGKIWRVRGQKCSPGWWFWKALKKKKKKYPREGTEHYNAG